MYPYLIQKNKEFLKEFPCQSGGSNRGPLACESDVLTTLLTLLEVFSPIDIYIIHIYVYIDISVAQTRHGFFGLYHRLQTHKVE